MSDYKRKNGYQLVNFCEFDKFAVQSYCAIHGVSPNLNLGDITKVDENNISPFNMICGGSPCQDFSVAGNQAGSRWKCKNCGHEYNPLTVHYTERYKCPKCGSECLDKTRSSLLVEWLRIIRANKPKWGIYENVKNIVGKRFRDTFDMLVEELHEYGYNTYWRILNSKDYGVPQNRERVYLIIVLKELDNGMFEFPHGFDSGIRLKDILEDKVDDKFYINTPQANNLVSDLIESGKLGKNDSITALVSKQCSQFEKQTNYAATLLARDYKGFGNQQGNAVIEKAKNAPIILGKLIPNSGKVHQNQEVYLNEGTSCTLKASHYKDPPKVLVESGKKASEESQKYIDNISDEYSFVKKKCLKLAEQNSGEIPTMFNAWNCIEIQDYAPTLTTSCNRAGGYTSVLIKQKAPDYRIRKLTPKECWRLMGFNDSDFEKAVDAGVSNSQLYKQAGNSIVVDVLYYIFKNLFSAMPYLFEDLRVSSYFSGIGAPEKALDRLFARNENGEQISSLSPNHEIVKLGMIEGNQHECNRRIYSIEGIAPTLTTCGGGGQEPKIIVAMRGRCIDGNKTEQKLQPRHDGLTNTLTSVTKDNLILERGKQT